MPLKCAYEATYYKMLSASLLQTELWKTIQGSSYCMNLIDQRGPFLTLKAPRFFSFSNFVM
jgi:hypothetical protein